MITDLQNWCNEAKRDGTSSRRWSDLKQVYIVPGMTEDDLRASLQEFALNNHLTITYEPIESKNSGEDQSVILCGR